MTGHSCKIIAPAQGKNLFTPAAQPVYLLIYCPAIRVAISRVHTELEYNSMVLCRANFEGTFSTWSLFPKSVSPFRLTLFKKSSRSLLRPTQFRLGRCIRSQLHYTGLLSRITRIGIIRYPGLLSRITRIGIIRYPGLLARIAKPDCYTGVTFVSDRGFESHYAAPIRCTTLL